MNENVVWINLKEYGGAMLEEDEADALVALERTVRRPLPKIPDKVIHDYLDNFRSVDNRRLCYIWKQLDYRAGFFPKDGHVIYLSLGGFYSIRENIFDIFEKRDEELHNPVITMPPECKCLKYLQELLVYVTEMPEFMNQFHNLERLTFRLDDITTLERLDFRNLNRLRYLSFRSNSPLTLPESLWELPSLQYLSIPLCQLTSISDKICQLKSLWGLIIYSNLLTSIPECIADLPHMRMVLMENNKIPDLPKKVKEFYKKKNSDRNSDFLFTSDFEEYTH